MWRYIIPESSICPSKNAVQYADMSKRAADQFNGIRIVRGKGTLSRPINIIVPDMDQINAPLQERTPNTIYIQDYVPQTDEHHTALGKFLQAWSCVETSLARLLAGLLHCNSRKAFAVFHDLGIRKCLETITSLATAELPDQSLDELSRLLDRITGINAKRNVLVHGTWVLEIVIWEWKGQIQIKGNLLREIAPTDFRLRDDIADLRNQKERVRHAFNVRRIQAATRIACEVLLIVGDFTKRHSNVFYMPPVGLGWQASEWLRPLHQLIRQETSIRFCRLPTNPLVSD